jgi:hypothetical protein
LIDCNMVVKEKTLYYLQEKNLSESINMIKIRDLHNNLNDNLDKNNTINKIKLKV